jgi:hypothetical protein
MFLYPTAVLEHPDALFAKFRGPIAVFATPTEDDEKLFPPNENENAFGKFMVAMSVRIALATVSGIEFIRLTAGDIEIVS